MRRRKSPIIIIIFLIIFSILAFLGIRMVTVPTDLAVNQTLESPQLIDLKSIVSTEPTASKSNIKYAVAVDNNLVYSSSETPQPTASTAKMILALMIMEKNPFSLSETGESITITPEFYQLYQNAVAEDGSTVPVEIGEVLSEYDALAGTLIASANNLADSLAIWAFGSLAEYCDFASTHLAEWGIKDTTISDASGFSPSTTSTAADLTIIGQKLMQNPVLSEIVGLKTYTLPIAGQIENTNQLLGISDITGVKTGYIGTDSGYCLISAYRLGEHTITTSVLDANTRADSFAYTKNLIDTIQNHLAEITIATTGTEVGNYDSWWTGQIPITVQEDVKILNWQPTTPVISLNTTGNAQGNTLDITINGETKSYATSTPDFSTSPSPAQRFERTISLK